MKAISSIVLSSYYGPTERNHTPLTLKRSWLEDVIAHQQRMGPYFKYASMQAGTGEGEVCKLDVRVFQVAKCKK